MIGRGVQNGGCRHVARAASGWASLGRGRRHRGEPRRIEQDRVDLGPQPRGRQLRIGDRRSPRRRPCIQRAFAVWWSAVACGYGTSTAGRPYCASSNTEPPARATARSAAASAGPKGIERKSAQVVVGSPGLLRSAKSRRPATCSTRYGASANAAYGRLVDRAGSERAAEDQHAALARSDPERGAGGCSRFGRRRAAPGARSPGSARPRARGSGNARETRRERAACSRLLSPRWRIGLGQHERDAAQRRREPHGSSDHSASPDHRVGFAVAQERRVRCAAPARTCRSRAAASTGWERETPSNADRVERVATPPGPARPRPADRRRRRPARPEPAARRPPRWPARRARRFRRPRSLSAVRSSIPLLARPAHRAQPRLNRRRRR